MSGIGNRFAAVFANRAIGAQCVVAVAGTNVIAVLAGNVVVVFKGVRRNALKAATLTVADRIAGIFAVIMVKGGITFSGFGVVRTANGADLLLYLGLRAGGGRERGPRIKGVLGHSREIAALAVAVGVAGVIKVVIQCQNVPRAGFFNGAIGANAVLDLGIQTICRRQGFPFAVVVIVRIDHSDKVAVLAVAIRIAIVFKIMAARFLTGRCFFCGANITEAVQNFIRRAACGNFGHKFGYVSVRDFSRVIATLAVAGNVASMIVNVVEWFTARTCFRSVATTAVSGFNTGRLAACRRGFAPIGEIVNVFTRCATVVANCIACIIVRVLGYASHGAADVAVRVASVIVCMRSGNSELAANIASGIASGSILVVRSDTKRTADITRGVASVGIHVRLGDSERAAKITGLVASIRICVDRLSGRAADVTVCVTAGVIGMLRSNSCFSADVTIGITSAAVGVGGRARAIGTADCALGCAFALVGVNSGLARLAAGVTRGVITICISVLRLGRARRLALVAGGIAGTRIRVVAGDGAACDGGQQKT